MNIQSYHRGEIENAHTLNLIADEDQPDCFGAGVAPAAHADRRIRIYANFILCFVGFMVGLRSIYSRWCGCHSCTAEKERGLSERFLSPKDFLPKCSEEKKIKVNSNIRSKMTSIFLKFAVTLLEKKFIHE